MPIADFINEVSKAPANAAGANSVLVDYKSPFEDTAYDDSKNKNAIDKVSKLMTYGNNPEMLKLSQEDLESFDKYNVLVTATSDYDKLVKQRAKNQSIAEQTWNSLVRAVGSEMGVGILKGFVDIADFVGQASVNSYDFVNDIINKIIAGNDKEIKLQGLDFNPESSPLAQLSNYLQEAKDKIDKSHTIYRTNPNDPLDWKSFSWYADNFPSVATTVSLMVPSYTLMKGMSLLGKATKFTTLADKAVKGMKLTPKTQEVLSALGKSSFMGLNSRIAENYQEAQQTYNQVKDIAGKYLSAMSEEERKEWDKLNPEYKDMDDEEIANNIANAKANLTFKEDFSNLGFDILQIYTLHNLLNNPRISTPRSLKTRNAKIANLFKEGKEITNATLKTTGFKNIALEKGKNFLYDSATLARAEWTEGVEEGINFIAQEDALYATQALFGNYPYNREEATIKQFGILPYGLNEQQFQDYVHNPEMWEQFIWGAIGGILFGGVYNKAVPFMQQKFGKQNNIQDKQKELSLLARNNIQQQYLNNIDLIKENKNPFNLNESGEAQEFRNEAEKKAVTDLVQKQFLTDLVLNANQNGTVDLLQSYFENQDTVEGYTNRIGEQETKQLQKDVLDAINKITPAYNKNFNKARRNGADNNTATMLARQYTNAELSLESLKNIENAYRAIYEDSLANTSADVTDINNLKDAYLLDYINKLNVDIGMVESDSTLTKTEKEKQINDINNKIEDAKSLMTNVHAFEDLSIEDGKEVWKTNSEKYNDAAKKLINIYQNKDAKLIGDMVSYLDAQQNVKELERDVNKTDEDVRKDVTFYNNLSKQAYRKVREKALEDTRDLIKKYGIEEVVRHVNGENTNISPEEKEKLDNAEEVDPDIIKKAKQDIDDEEEQLQYKRKDEPKTVPLGVGERIQNDENEEQGEQGEQEQQPVGKDDSVNPSIDEEEINKELVKPYKGILTYKDLVKSYARHKLAKGNSIDLQTLVDTVKDENGELYQIAKILGIKYTQDDIQNFLDLLAGAVNISKSSKFENTLRRTYGKFLNSTLRKSNVAFEAFVNDIVDVIKKDKGTNSGLNAFEHNGKIYISANTIKKFMEKYFANYGAIYEDTYEALMSYINSNNTNVVIVDKDEIKNLKKEDFANYGDQAWKYLQSSILANNENTVSLDQIGDKKKNYEAFAKLKQGDELVTKYNKDNNSVEVYTKDGEFIGYMANAKYNAEQGIYTGINKCWVYDIKRDNSKLGFASDFRNAIIKYYENHYDLVELLNNEKYKDFFETVEGDFKISDEEIENLFNLVVSNGLKKFITDDFELKSIHKRAALKHLRQLLYYAFEQNIDDQISKYVNLDSWFLRVLNGYEMTRLLSNKDNNDNTIIVVKDIDYGFKNQSDEYNIIPDTVENYNETDNKIVVGVQNSYDNVTETGYMSNGTFVSRKLSNGVPYITLKKPNGTLDFAQLNQPALTSIKSILGQDIRKAAIEEISNLIFDCYLGKKSVEETYDILKQLLNLDGLFRIVNGRVNQLNTKESKSLYVSYKLNGKEEYFYINGYKNNHRALGFSNFEEFAKMQNEENYNNYNLTEKNGKITRGFNTIKHSTKNANVKTAVRNVSTKLAEAILNDCTFAVSKTFLDKIDNQREFSNYYFTKQTIDKKPKLTLKLGRSKFEFNSYQDLLIKSEGVEVKLNNSTREIVEEDGTKIVTSGNWKFSPTGSKLVVSMLKEDLISESNEKLDKINKVHPIDSILNRRNLPINDFIEKGKLNINKFIEHVNNSPYISEEEKKDTIDYINSLNDLNIFEGTVRIDYTRYDDRVRSRMSYNPTTKIITIYADNIYNQNTSLHSLLITSVHENIHRIFDTSSTLKKRKIFNEVGGIRRQLINHLNNNFKYKNGNYNVKGFRNWLNENTGFNQWDDFKAQNLIDLLNNKQHKTEEFIAESLTNIQLMYYLNSVKANKEIEDTKEESLFSKIINAILKFFGVKVNKNSLLDNLLKMYKTYTVDDVMTVDTNLTQEDIDIETPKEDTEENNSKDESDFSDLFSTYDNVLSLSDLKTALPYQIQPKFDELTAAGEISFTCV